MKPLQLQPLATLFSSSSGKDKCRVKTEVEEEEQHRKKTEEDESEPLISLGLGIGGSSKLRNNSDNVREKDSSFNNNRIVMVKEEEENYDQVVECRNYSVVRFTEDQIEELKRQILILNYINWGLPVPFQLLHPIWRTFSSSSASFPPHFYRYKTSPPHFLLSYFCGSGGFDHPQMMDPEPGRCRRTDGKKWRCHQSVIPNEKYCAKHMHRGSKRSRKLVEASPYSRIPEPIDLNQNSDPSNDIKPKLQENPDQNGSAGGVMRAPGLITCIAKSNEPDKRNSNPGNDVKPKFRENLDQNVPTGVVMRASGLNTCTTAKSNGNDEQNNNRSNDAKLKFPKLDQNRPIGVVVGAPDLTTCTAKSNENNKRNNNSSNDIWPKFSEDVNQNRPAEVVMIAQGLNTCTAESNKQYRNPNCDVRPKFPENLYQNASIGVVMRAPGLTTCIAKSYENDKKTYEAKCEIVANERIAVINKAPGLDFSPKSVLQEDAGVRCLGAESCRNSPESESRCRRTDGKKWRCKNEVIPDQKYCVQHVNRGRSRSKKRSLDSSASRKFQAACCSTSNAKSSRTEQTKVNSGIDTNLKISLPTRFPDPKSFVKDSMTRNGGSSSSSEATESDESTDVLDIIVLSP